MVSLKLFMSYPIAKSNSARFSRTFQVIRLTLRSSNTLNKKTRRSRSSTKSSKRKALKRNGAKCALRDGHGSNKPPFMRKI